MIRYDNKLKSEISRTIKNYNAKVRRLSKKNLSDVYVPNLLHKEDVLNLKRSVETRTDLRKRLKDLQSFTEKGAEKIITKKGVTAPKYIHKQLTRYNRILTRQLKKEEYFVTKATPRSFGRAEKLTRKEALDEDYAKFISKKRLRYKDLEGESINKIVDHLHKLKVNTKMRDYKQFRENFIEMLVDTAYLYDVPHAKVRDMVDSLRSLSPEEFNNFFNEDRSLNVLINYYATTNILGVDVAYESNIDNAKEYFEELINNLDEMVEGYKERTTITEDKFEKEAREWVLENYPEKAKNKRNFKTLVSLRKDHLKRTSRG